MNLNLSSMGVHPLRFLAESIEAGEEYAAAVTEAAIERLEYLERSVEVLMHIAETGTRPDVATLKRHKASKPAPFVAPAKAETPAPAPAPSSEAPATPAPASPPATVQAQGQTEQPAAEQAAGGAA